MKFDEWLASLSYQQLRFIVTEQRNQYSLEELNKITQEIQSRESQMASKDQKRFNRARQEELRSIKEQRRQEEKNKEAKYIVCPKCKQNILLIQKDVINVPLLWANKKKNQCLRLLNPSSTAPSVIPQIQ